MLTSEELFPLEYCFDGSCKQSPSPFYSRPPLHPLRICTPYTLRVVFHLPPRGPAPAPAPFTRRHCFNETGNVQFVRPAPGPAVRESRVRPLYFAMHSRALALLYPSRLSCRARKIRPARSQRRALTRVHQHRTAASSYGVPSRREIISFFFLLFLSFFLKTHERAPYRLHLL